MLITSILNLSAYIAMALGVIAIAIGIYYGLRAKDKNLRRQGKYLIIASLSLLCYLFFATHRYRADGVEIFCTLSIITLFFVLDTNYLASMAIMKVDLSERWGLFITLNIIVLITLGLSIFAHVFMGYDTSYHNWAEAVRHFEEKDPDIITRSGIFMGLIIFAVEIVREIAVAYIQVRQELNFSTASEHSLIRWAIVTIAWGVVIALLGIGEFVTFTSYHLLINIVIILLLVQTIIGYLHFNLVAKPIVAQERVLDTVTEQKVNKWMRQRPFPLKENLSMDDIAQASGIRREDLSAYIYNDLGLTFTAWQRDCRLDHCRELLANTDLTISQIADETGYNELAALSKAFKQKYGIPPSQYRKR